MPNRDGTWAAQGSLLTIAFIRDDGEMSNCGSTTKTKSVKLGIEVYPYQIYIFNGKPALSLSFGPADRESLYRGQ
jgi:hypothetical protein